MRFGKAVPDLTALLRTHSQSCSLWTCLRTGVRQPFAVETTFCPAVHRVAVEMGVIPITSLQGTVGSGSVICTQATSKIQAKNTRVKAKAWQEQVVVATCCRCGCRRVSSCLGVWGTVAHRQSHAGQNCKGDGTVLCCSAGRSSAVCQGPCLALAEGNNVSPLTDTPLQCTDALPTPVNFPVG